MSRTLVLAGFLGFIALTISGCGSKKSSVNNSPADFVSQTDEGTFSGTVTAGKYGVKLVNGKLSNYIDAENANMQLNMSVSITMASITVAKVSVEAILNVTAKRLTVHVVVADLPNNTKPIRNCSYLVLPEIPPANVTTALKNFMRKQKPNATTKDGDRKFERSIDLNVNVPQAKGEVKADGKLYLNDDQVMHNMHFDGSVLDATLNGSAEPNVTMTADYLGTTAKKGANASAFAVPSEWGKCTPLNHESKSTAEMIPAMLFELLNTIVAPLDLSELKVSEVVV